MDDPKTGAADFADSAERRGNSVSRDKDKGLLHRRLTGAIIGAMYVVYRELGSGFLETVYANALTVILRAAGLKVDREVVFEIIFHGERIGWYRADMIVEGKVLVEVKAGRAIHTRHCVQVRNYRRASGLQVGLVLNFGRSAEAKRVIMSTA